jgi:5-methylcytosine-specific restriction endonuclease McrA
MPDDRHLDELDPKQRRKAHRQQILQRFGGHCFYCWEKPERLTIDHIIPRSKGGTEYHGNLAPSCHRCNGSKSDKEVIAWLRSQSFYSPEVEARVREWVV